MFLEVTAHSKGFAADVTNKRSLSRVNLDMCIEMRFRGKFLVAESTGIRFNSQMRVYVVHKVSFNVKLFLALITLINGSVVQFLLPNRRLSGYTCVDV